MLATCDDAVAIHGCKVASEVVFVGELDSKLAAEVSAAMTKASLKCHLDGHEFPRTHSNIIRNRRHRGAGVQLLLSAAFRESSSHKGKLVAAVRAVLLPRAAGRTQPWGCQFPSLTY
jgi:phage replication-related protein YjqB (UPF0714/DUF867 family)